MPTSLPEILKSMLEAPLKNLILILVFSFMAFFMYIQNQKEERMLVALEKISEAIDKQNIVKQQESERIKDLINAIMPIPDLIRPIMPEIRELRNDIYRYIRKNE